MNKSAIKRTIKRLSSFPDSKKLIEKFKNQCFNDERIRINSFFDECLQYVDILRVDDIESRSSFTEKKGEEI